MVGLKSETFLNSLRPKEIYIFKFVNNVTQLFRKLARKSKIRKWWYRNWTDWNFSLTQLIVLYLFNSPFTALIFSQHRLVSRLLTSVSKSFILGIYQILICTLYKTVLMLTFGSLGNDDRQQGNARVHRYDTHHPTVDGGLIYCASIPRIARSERDRLSTRVSRALVVQWTSFFAPVHTCKTRSLSEIKKVLFQPKDPLYFPNNWTETDTRLIIESLVFFVHTNVLDFQKIETHISDDIVAMKISIIIQKRGVSPFSTIFQYVRKHFEQLFLSFKLLSLLQLWETEICLKQLQTKFR